MTHLFNRKANFMRIENKLLYLTAFLTVICFFSDVFAEAYPNIDIVEKDGGSYVYWDNEELVVLDSNRYLTRFRSNPSSEEWVGNHTKSTDLGWAYNDTGAKGLEVLGTNHYNDPENGEFALIVSGKKPHFASSIQIVFKGIWMPDKAKFKYKLYTSFDCALEDWYQNSDGHRLEITDYRIDYISKPERLASPAQKEPQKYEWFVDSSDGLNWQKKPKIHIPYVIRPGDYITIRDKSNLAGVGDYFGFLDREYGGWITKITKTSGPILYEICWMLLDVHIVLDDAIPPRYSTDNLSHEFEIEFFPVDKNESLNIIDQASEINWRDDEEYQLPVFTKDDDFQTLITDIPGEETGFYYLWWASNYDCYRDSTTGYDDYFSATIKVDGEPSLPTAWYTFSWGAAYEDTSYSGHRVKLSAMVKTSECTGEVRIGTVSTSGDFWYGKGTHNDDGTPKTDTGLNWIFSEPVSGTTDWQLISVEFNVTSSRPAVLLEQNGSGQSWFDNVKIEDLGPAYPIYNGDIPGEVKINGSGIAEMEDDAIKLTQTGTDIQAAYVELETTEKDKEITAEFQFKIGELTGWKCLYVYDNNLDLAVPLHVNADKLALNLGGGNYLQTGITMIRDQWYTAKLVMSIQSHTYDVYIDGVRKVKNQTMNSSLGNRFRRIYFHTGGTLYIRNVRAYKSIQKVSSYIVGEQDFDDTEYPMGSFIAGTVDRTKVTIDKTLDNHFLRISRQGSDTNARIDFFSDNSLVDIRFKFMVSSLSGTKVMYLSDGWNRKVPLAILSGNLMLYYGSSLPEETVTLFAVTPERWYSVKALVDVQNDLYDLFIDNDQMAANKPVANSLNKTINRMYLTAQSLDSDLCIDDIAIYNVECGYSGYLATDLNYDCYVNTDDLVVLAAQWLKSTETDFNNNGISDLQEFAFLAEQWFMCTDPVNSDCIEL